MYLFILGIATGLLVYYVFDKKVEPKVEEYYEEYEQELSKIKAEKLKAEAELAAFKAKFDQTIQKLRTKL